MSKPDIEAIKSLAQSIAAEFVDFNEVVYIGPSLEFSATFNGGQKIPRYTIEADFDLMRHAVAVCMTVWPHSGIVGYAITDQLGILDSREDFATRWRGHLEKAKQEGVFS